MNETKVGKYFKDKDGNIYQMVSFCAEPTATFQKVGAMPKQIGGSIYSPNVTQFTQLSEQEQEITQKLYNQFYGMEEGLLERVSPDFFNKRRE